MPPREHLAAQAIKPPCSAVQANDPAVQESSAHNARPIEELDSVVIRFAGDAGDGMELAGAEFSKTVAHAGLDFATQPDPPSQIRAPAGSLFGISGFQIQYSPASVFTSGDQVDVLVAMNPAALRANSPDYPVPIGIFRAVTEPTYEQRNSELHELACASKGRGHLNRLLNSGGTWTIESSETRSATWL